MRITEKTGVVIISAVVSAFATYAAFNFTLYELRDDISILNHDNKLTAEQILSKYHKANTNEEKAEILKAMEEYKSKGISDW
jgi:hypothetical protein